jgi:hypothetical protein
VADPDTVKHLELIQGVVGRLAGNSFTIKGWSITLVSVLVGFAAKDANARFAVVALLPAFCFWGLDAYYLRQERLFRALYDQVRSGRATVALFGMDTASADSSVDSVAVTALSKTVAAVHLPIVVAVVAVMLYARLQ